MRPNVISISGAEVPALRRGMIPLEGMGQDYTGDGGGGDGAMVVDVPTDFQPMDPYTVPTGDLTPPTDAYGGSYFDPGGWYYDPLTDMFYDPSALGAPVNSSGQAFDIFGLPLPTPSDTAMLSEAQPLVFVSEADSGFAGGIFVDSVTGQLYSATSGAALVGPPASATAVASQVVRQVQQQKAAAASGGGGSPSGAPSGGKPSTSPLAQPTLPGTKPPTVPSWFSQQTIIRGIPNGAVVAGGAVVAFVLFSGGRASAPRAAARRR
jgi:hypothetical protein